MSRVLSVAPSRSGDETVGAARSRPPQPADTRESPIYHLNVVASGVADVVESAGGWLFDRAMAGWAVNVFVDDVEGARPLQILGAQAFDVGTAMAMITETRGRAADLAVSGDLLATEVWLREEVAATVRAGLAEVAFWGDTVVPETSHHAVGRLHVVEYRLSAAARVFKEHALDAAGRADVLVGPIETLLAAGHHPSTADLARTGDPVG